MFRRVDPARIPDFYPPDHACHPTGPQFFPYPEKLWLVVATEKTVCCLKYLQLTQRKFDDNWMAGETIQDLKTFPSSQGDRVILSTRSGKMILLNRQGLVEVEQPIAPVPVRQLLYASQSGSSLLIASCLDQALRLLDVQGRVKGVITTPGNLLFLDAHELDGQLKLAGGLQDRNEVLIWDLDEVIKKKDASPQFILPGGKQPAYAACFIEIGNELLIAHSSWDGNVYLYPVPIPGGEPALLPRSILHSSTPLYAVRYARLNGAPFLFAGGENGRIFGWDLRHNLPSQAPSVTSTSSGSAVKTLRIAIIGPQREIILFAGNRTGQIQIIKPTFTEMQLFNNSWLDYDRGEIRGIELIEENE